MKVNIEKGNQNVGQVLSLAKAEKENLKLGTVFLGGVTVNMTRTQKNNPTVLAFYCYRNKLPQI